MSKKTQKKSSLKSLILVLLLTAVLLVVSTYAWFTANREVQVSNIEVNVEAQNGIEISVDGYTWKTILTVEDLKNASATYAAAVNQIPTTLQPVSSSGAINAEGRQLMYYGNVTPDEDADSDTYGQYILTSEAQTDANGTNGNYVAFDMFLKLDSATATTPVYLNSRSGITVPESSTDTGLKNSARISFINEGFVATENISNVDAIQALKLDGTVEGAINKISGNANAYIWEPNCNIHTASGISNAFTYYGKTIQADSILTSYDGLNTTFASKIALSNAKVMVDDTQTDGVDESTFFKKVTPNLQTNVNNTAQTNLMTLSSGVTKIRVYFWIEGQDVDCENNASGSKITLNLDLTTTAI